jgi:hypothetical protein
MKNQIKLSEIAQQVAATLSRRQDFTEEVKHEAINVWDNAINNPSLNKVLLMAFPEQNDGSETKMQPHQERVIEEQRELVEKLGKLKEFMQTKTYDSLPMVECVRLRRQSLIMDLYVEVLAERIAAFN